MLELEDNTVGFESNEERTIEIENIDISFCFNKHVYD